MTQYFSILGNNCIFIKEDEYNTIYMIQNLYIKQYIIGYKSTKIQKTLPELVFMPTTLPQSTPKSMGCLLVMGYTPSSPYVEHE